MCVVHFSGSLFPSAYDISDLHLLVCCMYEEPLVCGGYILIFCICVCAIPNEYPSDLDTTKYKYPCPLSEASFPLHNMIRRPQVKKVSPIIYRFYTIHPSIHIPVLIVTPNPFIAQKLPSISPLLRHPAHGLPYKPQKNHLILPFELTLSIFK